MGGLFNDFRAWFAQPFSPGMSATTLFFGIGLVIVITILWVLIIEKLEETVE